MTLLDLLIAPAFAQDAAPAGGSPFSLMLLLGIFAVFLIFTTILPQRKRKKEHAEMMARLAVGDEVLTYGGIGGVVRGLGETFLTIEIADKVHIQVQRGAVANTLPKGTLKAA